MRLLLYRQRARSCPACHVGDELALPIAAELIDVAVTEHRHVACRRKLRRSRNRMPCLLATPDALLDPSTKNFLHLGFAQRAVAVVLDAIRDIVNIRADPL